MAYIIDGKAEAEALKVKVKSETIQLVAKGVVPGLAVIIVGEDPASQVYVKNKELSAKASGFKSIKHEMPETVPERELIDVIEQLNQDNTIHGILVQLPLPKHINEELVINAISPEKDVDGFTEINVGRLSIGKKGLVPCTPLGCIMLLKKQLGDDLSGKHAVMIGRSNIVGKPMAALLLKESCTVTIAHSKTKDIESICRVADIVIAGVGRANMIKKSWLNDNTVVIDVGINRIQSQDKSYLVGDVDFDEVSPYVQAITPVPGGVGPMTIACLMLNTLTAAKQIHGFD